MGRRLLLIAGLALAFGCAAQRAPVVIVGPLSGAPSDAAFERVLQAASSRGYEALDVDPVGGRFEVRAHAGPADRFVVQCYANGHVAITPAGSRVHPDGRVFIVPAELRRELVAFAQLLDAAARGL